MPESKGQKKGWRTKGLWLGLFLVHALPFVSRPALIGGDEPHYALMASSIAIDGDVSLEADYARVPEGSVAAGRKLAGKELDAHLRPLGDGVMFSHPIGLPLLAAPLIFLQQAVAPGASPDLLLGLLSLLLTFAAGLAGWDLLCRWLGDSRQGTILAVAFYFSTPLWFYSRTFFTEPYLWSLAVLAAWAGSKERWWTSSFSLGAMFFLKESAALVIVPVLLASTVARGFRHGARMAVFPACFFALFVAKNLWLYGRAWVPFQEFHAGSLLEGLLGVLADPRHGLLVFAPLVVLAIPRAVRGPGDSLIDTTARGIVLLQILVVSAWVDWGGGSCYGPRLLLPAFPALAALLALSWRCWWREIWFRALFSVLAGLGLGVQLTAALDPFSAFWSAHVLDLLGEGPIPALVGAAGGGLGFWKSLETAATASPRP